MIVTFMLDPSILSIKKVNIVKRQPIKIIINVILILHMFGIAEIDNNVKIKEHQEYLIHTNYLNYIFKNYANLALTLKDLIAITMAVKIVPLLNKTVNIIRYLEMILKQINSFVKIWLLIPVHQFNAIMDQMEYYAKILISLIT